MSSIQVKEHVVNSRNTLFTEHSICFHKLNKKTFQQVNGLLALSAVCMLSDPNDGMCSGFEMLFCLLCQPPVECKCKD